MTDERFTPEQRKAMLDGLGLSVVVDIDRVFDTFPDRDDGRVALAEPGAEQWRPVFRGAPGISAIARRASFATLAALAPDEPATPAAEGAIPMRMPPSREWAVMTYGFASEAAAALAGIVWTVSLAKAMDAEPGDMLLYLRSQPFRPGWRGYP